MSIEEKLTLLFGGQDVSGGNDSMVESRKANPNFFCHKYGWSTSRILRELTNIGFKEIVITNEYTNLIAVAKK